MVYHTDKARCRVSCIEDILLSELPLHSYRQGWRAGFCGKGDNRAKHGGDHSGVRPDCTNMTDTLYLNRLNSNKNRNRTETKSKRKNENPHTQYATLNNPDSHHGSHISIYIVSPGHHSIALWIQRWHTPLESRAQGPPL